MPIIFNLLPCVGFWVMNSRAVPVPIAERPRAIRGPVERRLGSGFGLLGFVRPVCRFRGRIRKRCYPQGTGDDGGEPHRRSFTFLNRLKLQSERIFVCSKLHSLKKSKCDVGQDEVVKVEKPIKRTGRQRTDQLVAAGMVLRRHENQAGSCFRLPRLLLRGTAASLQDPEDCRISSEHANSNGEHYRKAQNQRHEKRNHNQPPFAN